MKYALNTKKGTTFNHPTVGSINGGTAIEITDEEAAQLNHRINIMIFDKVENRLTGKPGKKAEEESP